MPGELLIADAFIHSASRKMLRMKSIISRKHKKNKNKNNKAQTSAAGGTEEPTDVPRAVAVGGAVDAVGYVDRGDRGLRSVPRVFGTPDMMQVVRTTCPTNIVEYYTILNRMQCMQQKQVVVVVIATQC